MMSWEVLKLMWWTKFIKDEVKGSSDVDVDDDDDYDYDDEQHRVTGFR